MASETLGFGGKRRAGVSDVTSGQPFTQVDAFTDRPFAGNPAAVCILPSPRGEEWMRAVARELNLSETAFLRPESEAWGLRWFTPAVEVELCGHATLAAAHVLWEEERVPRSEALVFHTRSGQLGARREGEWIELDFPAEPVREVPAPAGLADALGVEPTRVGRNRLDWLVELGSEEEVRDATPDFGRLRGLGRRGVIVTARSSDAEYDFLSRYFAPACGIDEDPVTGSAHCALGPYWASRLGKQELCAFQASARGGEVRVRLRGERVGLRGRAVTVLRGEILV